MGKVKIWYNRKAGRVGGDWIVLKDEFCLFFFPITKVMPLRIQLLLFKQGRRVTWSSVGKIHADGNFWTTSQYSRRDANAALRWWIEAGEHAFHECLLRVIHHVQDSG
jgi:hypothetical protein